MCHRHRSSYTVQKERRKTVVSVKPSISEKRPMSAAPEWVVVDFERRGFHCERCGASEAHSSLRGVSRLESFTLRGQAFAIDHADCKELESPLSGTEGRE